MKKSELRNLIREEIQKLKEAKDIFFRIQLKKHRVSFSKEDIQEMIDDPKMYLTADNLFKWIGVADMEGRGERFINEKRVIKFLKKLVKTGKPNYLDITDSFNDKGFKLPN